VPDIGGLCKKNTFKFISSTTYSRRRPYKTFERKTFKFEKAFFESISI